MGAGLGLRWRASPYRAHERRSSRPSASCSLLPGTDSGLAALLGGLRLRDSAALRYGGRRRHVSPGNHLARARAQAVERGLCATFTPAEGRPLWRESQPPAALLPISSDPEALAGRYSGALSQIARRDRHRSPASRYPFRGGRLGKPHAWRLGARLGV